VPSKASAKELWGGRKKIGRGKTGGHFSLHAEREVGKNEKTYSSLIILQARGVDQIHEKEELCRGERIRGRGKHHDLSLTKKKKKGKKREGRGVLDLRAKPISLRREPGKRKKDQRWGLQKNIMVLSLFTRPGEGSGDGGGVKPPVSVKTTEGKRPRKVVNTENGSSGTESSIRAIIRDRQRKDYQETSREGNFTGKSMKQMY